MQLGLNRNGQVVCADERILYKHIIFIIDLTKRCGFAKVSLVSKTESLRDMFGEISNKKYLTVYGANPFFYLTCTMN